MRPQNTKHYYRALRIDLFLGVLTPIINFIAERKDHKQSTLKIYVIIMKTIKFLSLLMLVALSAGFASCSDDDEKVEPTLVGIWEPTYTEGWEKYADSPKDNTQWKDTWTAQHKYSEAFKKIVFNEDKTGTYTFDQENMVGDGTTEVTKEFTWSYENKKFTMIVKGEEDFDDEGGTRSEEINIIELTENTFALEMSFELKLDGYSSYEKITYTRVK